MANSNKKRILVEGCCGNIEDALLAAKLGADRIEFCANLEQGGQTPTYGQLACLRKAVQTVPIFVLIRPRPGNFVYSELEFETMKEDISVCRALGLDGVVFGILQPNGTIDVERCTVLCQLA